MKYIRNMRKEFKYFIGALVMGFVLCAVMFMLSVAVFASEVEQESETALDLNAFENETLIVQDEQPEIPESSGSSSDLELMGEDQPLVEPEQHSEIVHNEQNSESESSVHIEPFASGVIVGELADLLQENVFENDGYTDESWERYENAVASGWVAISNFMTYTNDEVRAVIDELQAAILGLEYPPGVNPDKPDSVELDADFMTVLLVGSGIASGSTCGLAFMVKFQPGV